MIAYDVANDRRRRNVARVLQQYGARIQKSVFVAWLESDEARDVLRRQLGPLLRHGDLLDILPLDTRAADRQYSWQHAGVEMHSVMLIG